MPSSKVIAIWLALTVFVQVTIITPYFDPIDNDRIGEAQHQIERLITSKMSALSDEGELSNQLILREEIYKLHKEHIDLGLKRTTRTFEIPVFSIKFSRPAVTVLYPLLIFCGLGFVLISRYHWVQSHPGLVDAIPYWVYPIKSRQNSHLTFSYFISNVAILSHVVLLVWAIDFLTRQQSREGIRTEYFVFNIVTAALLILMYTYVFTMKTIQIESTSEKTDSA